MSQSDHLDDLAGTGEFGQLLRRLRQGAGLSSRTIDERTCGADSAVRLSRSQISRVEQGTQLPDRSWLRAFLNQCGVATGSRLYRQVERVRDRLEQGDVEAVRRPVTEWAPNELDIHPPITAADAANTGVLTGYVRRNHDTALDEAIRDLSSSIMIVVTGRSASGKTRAMYEAASHHIELNKWPLLYPRTAPDLLATFDSGRVRPRTLLWLDDAQNHLSGPSGQAVAARLRLLLDGSLPGPVVVLSSMWSSHWAGLTAPPDSWHADSDSSHSVVRHLLTHSVRRVHVEPFDPVRTAELAVLPNIDPRVQLAAATVGPGTDLTQVLAGGPALLERYLRPGTDEARFGAAVTAAAVEIRRAGHHGPLPRPLLSQAAGQFVVVEECDEEPPENWFDNGLAHATRRVNGVRALTPISLTGDYLPHEYLSEVTSTQRPRHPVPSTVWAMLIEFTIDVDDRCRLAETARKGSLYRCAAQLVGAAAMGGNANACRVYAELLLGKRRFDEAGAWMRVAAANGDVASMLRLAEFLWTTTRSKHWTPSIGGFEMDQLNYLDAHVVPSEVGQEVGELRQRALGAGADTPEVLWLLARQPDGYSYDDNYLRRAAESGHPEAIRNWMIHGDRGREAEAWLQDLAESGDAAAIDAWVEYLERYGRHSEADDWLRRKIVHFDDALIEMDLPGRLEAAGLPKLARQWLRRVSSDNPYVGYNDVRELDAEGQSALADEMLRAMIEHDPGTAIRELVWRLGDAEAEQLLNEKAEGGLITAMSMLAERSHKAGRRDEAEHWWRLATDNGDFNAMKSLSQALTDAGRHNDAEHFLRHQVEVGLSFALDTLAKIVSAQGRREEAMRLQEYGIEPGGNTSDRWDWPAELP